MFAKNDICLEVFVGENIKPDATFVRLKKTHSEMAFKVTILLAKPVNEVCRWSGKREATINPSEMCNYSDRSTVHQ